MRAVADSFVKDQLFIYTQAIKRWLRHEFSRIPNSPAWGRHCGAPPEVKMPDQITVRGARLHNLKNLSLSIPKNQFVVLTGQSGSGKFTLGFDILLKEGQRQYMEALGMVTFGLSKPPVDAITGLSPTISVDQHLTNHSPRSTVGTATGQLLAAGTPEQVAQTAGSHTGRYLRELLKK